MSQHCLCGSRRKTVVFPVDYRRELAKPAQIKSSSSAASQEPPWLHPVTRALIGTDGHQNREHIKSSTVTLYFGKEMEKLRAVEGFANNAEFIMSMEGLQNRSMPYGKSKASWFTTSDERLIFKTVHPHDMRSFVRYAKAYFKYMEAYGEDTMIAKTLCAFTVQVGCVTYNILVMEYVHNFEEAGIDYDWKGTQGEVRTKYQLSPSSYDRFHKVLRRDTGFMKRWNVSDYSLMVKEGREYLMVALVDCLTYRSTIGYVRLHLRYGCTCDRTVVSPCMYRARMLRAFTSTFVCEECDSVKNSSSASSAEA